MRAASQKHEYEGSWRWMRKEQTASAADLPNCLPTWKILLRLSASRVFLKRLDDAPSQVLLIHVNVTSLLCFEPTTLPLRSPSCKVHSSRPPRLTMPSQFI